LEPSWSAVADQPAPVAYIDAEARFHHDRQGRIRAKDEKVANEVTNIDLPLEWPIKAQACEPQFWEVLTHQIANRQPHAVFLTARQSAPF
jgi:hypothetical protein